MMDRIYNWRLFYYLIVALLFTIPLPVWADGPNQVGLVVVYGGGDVSTHCVPFSDDRISGHEVLKRAGLELETELSGGSGAAICFIEKKGCRVSQGQPCFCECQGSPCVYWSYWHLKGERWEYSSAGASSYFVRHGDVEGWVWGAGQPNEAPSPPLIPFDQICVPPTATPTPTETLTPIPLTDTPTPKPTATSTPTPLPPPSISFALSAAEISQGECAQLTWKVEQAKAVYLDGQGVTGEESRPVCPAPGAHVFELHVIGLDGEEYRRQVSLQVMEKPTATSTVTPLAEMATVQAVQTTDEGPTEPSSVTDGQAEAAADASQATTSSASPTAATDSSEAEPTATVLALAQPSAGASTPAGTPLAIAPPAQSTAAPSQPPDTVSPPDQGHLPSLLASKVFWFIVLAGTAVGIVGGGGLAFVGCIVLLFLIYRRFSRIDDHDDER